MDTFDDIQIEESQGFEYGEYLSDELFEEDENEQLFFDYLKSNIDF